MIMNTHDAIIRHGRYRGERLTRVPVGYLRWAVGASVASLIDLKDGSQVKFHQAARAEIDRRGERLQDVEISGHALDRLSFHALNIWHQHRRSGEGLYSWAQRATLEALEKAGPAPDGTETIRAQHCDIQWVIKIDQAIPALLTVLPGS